MRAGASRETSEASNGTSRHCRIDAASGSSKLRDLRDMRAVILIRIVRPVGKFISPWKVKRLASACKHQSLFLLDKFHLLDKVQLCTRTDLDRQTLPTRLEDHFEQKMLDTAHGRLVFVFETELLIVVELEHYFH